MSSRSSCRTPTPSKLGAWPTGWSKRFAKSARPSATRNRSPPASESRSRSRATTRSRCSAGRIRRRIARSSAGAIGCSERLPSKCEANRVDDQRQQDQRRQREEREADFDLVDESLEQTVDDAE